jgi:hypothetical protein
MNNLLLESAIRQFAQYKLLAEKSFLQLSDEQLFKAENESSNSIAVIVKHMWGNMISRWTDFLTSDGEKDWRERDAEFQNDMNSREDMVQKWEEGWACLFNTLQHLKTEDLELIVTIRSQPLTVTDAILRQLTHYAYHIGQIVYIGKVFKSEKWNSLSIPKGGSAAYLATMRDISK